MNNFPGNNKKSRQQTITATSDLHSLSVQHINQTADGKKPKINYDDLKKYLLKEY